MHLCAILKPSSAFPLTATILTLSPCANEVFFFPAPLLSSSALVSRRNPLCVGTRWQRTWYVRLCTRLEPIYSEAFFRTHDADSPRERERERRVRRKVGGYYHFLLDALLFCVRGKNPALLRKQEFNNHNNGGSSIGRVDEEIIWKYASHTIKKREHCFAKT